MTMNLDQSPPSLENIEKASKGEINSWRRGFTPQAEIWNGRMAMFALIICMISILSMKISPF